MKLSTVDLLISQILTKITVMLDNILKTGLRTWLAPTILMELELIPSQKYLQISGLNLDKLLVFSKWESALTEIQIMLVLIHTILPDFSTIHYTLPLRMFLDLDRA
jgi:hypothetical protein